MSMPLVDVGMPAHGRPDFLTDALESVLGQRHPDWRLLVLDDPGGGLTEEAVRHYLRDPRVAYRPTNKPLSATEAMTALLQAGDAPYFAFLHDDDGWGPGFLERRIDFLERHPDCALVWSGHLDIDAAGRVTARHPLDFQEGVVPREALFPRFCFHNLVDTMHSVVVRRSALNVVGAHLDRSCPRLFDWELWLRFALRFPIGFVHGEDDVLYRVHGEQMSGRMGEADDFLTLFRRADAALAHQAPELRAGEGERRRHLAGLFLSVALDRVQERDRRAALSALGAALRLRPRSALHRRFAAALAGLALGAPGRTMLSRSRQAAYGRDSARDRPAGTA
jgi:glycosyltransferase involved in cell wall biosynthesis